MRQFSAKAGVLITLVFSLIMIGIIAWIAISFDVGRTPGLLYLWSASIIGMLIFTLVGVWQCFAVMKARNIK